LAAHHIRECAPFWLVSSNGRRPDADQIQGQKRPAGVIGNAVGTMRIANIKQPTNARLCFQVSN
jgi:hypothetical protein